MFYMYRNILETIKKYILKYKIYWRKHIKTKKDIRAYKGNIALFRNS